MEVGWRSQRHPCLFPCLNFDHVTLRGGYHKKYKRCLFENGLDGSEKETTNQTSPSPGGWVRRGGIYCLPKKNICKIRHTPKTILNFSNSPKICSMTNCILKKLNYDLSTPPNRVRGVCGQIFWYHVLF